MVDNTRLTASASNAQALKFKIVNTPAECAKVFSTVKWAGALTDWDGPAEGERPSAYIIIACDLSWVGTNSGTTASPPRPSCSARWRRLRRLHDRQL